MRNAQPEDVHPIQIATHGIGVDDPSFRRALELFQGQRPSHGEHRTVDANLNCEVLV